MNQKTLAIAAIVTAAALTGIFSTTLLAARLVHREKEINLEGLLN